METSNHPFYHALYFAVFYLGVSSSMTNVTGEARQEVAR
jgi:hypothetical protein